MRTFKLFNFNLRSSAMVQADGCTTARPKIGVTPRTTSTIGRFASVLCIVLTMLFTLGVGQMWATSGTITVYFKNTIGWTNVYVYFYDGAYWDTSNGSGSASGGSFKSGPNTMTYDSDLGLFKYTYTGTYSGVISFTKDSQKNYNNFYNTQAVYRADFSTSSPIYIPNSGGTSETKNGTKYYTQGQWVSTTQRTVYLATNWANPKAYCWNSYGEQFAWSGQAMTLISGKTYDGKAIYSYTTKYDAAYIKFSNNGASETGNLTLGSTNAGKLYNGSSWVTYEWDHVITSGSTIVWDLAGDNADYWPDTYMYRIHYVADAEYDTYTKLSNNQRYKTYASDTYCKSFLFTKDNPSSWSNWRFTTDITGANCDVDGITLFTYDNTTTSADGHEKLNWQITKNAKKGTDDVKVYFDNTNTGWSKIYFNYGTDWFNRSIAYTMTKVTGTANLYVLELPQDIYYKEYFLSAETGTNANNYENIETATGITKRTTFQAFNLAADSTIIPATGTGTPKVSTVSKIAGHTRQVSITEPSHGTITVAYSNESGASQSVTSGDFDVAQTCSLTVSSDPATGYDRGTLKINNTSHTSGDVYIIRENISVEATFTPNNYTVTLNNQSATSAGTETIAVTFDANTNLTSAITEPVKTGYAFGGYYTATGGGGTQIIDADGNVVASAGGGSTYTDASKNWKYANNITLYAKWTAVTTVAADPDLDICQVTGLFGLSGFANVGLNGGCLGATESISGKNTRHIYGQTEGEFRTLDLRNAPTRDRVHFEVWAAEAFTFTLKLAGWNSGWHYSGTQDYTTTAGAWKEIDVPLSNFTDYADCFGDAFTGFILSNLGNKDIWFANVYLYTESSACAAEPSVAPSAPTYPACQVHSIYSDTYASIGMSYADWGSGSSKTDETVAGTNMYKVTVNNGNFGGMILNGKIDASSYEYIHMDVWTPLASTFRFSPICWNYTSSGKETEQYKTGISTTAATWTSVDIPVSYFTDLGLTMRGNYQLKIDQYTGTYFWITNIYYYNTSSCPSYTPEAGTHRFGTAQRQNVALYSDASMATGRHANTSKPLAQRFDYYIVDCGEQMLSKVVTRGKLGTGVYDQMVQVWNNAKTAYQENKLSRHNAAATIGFQRIGDADQYKWNGQTTTAPMNFYMNFQEQTTGLGYSEFFNYQRGYINNPNSDETAPTLTSVASTSETNWFTLTFTGGNDNSGQWFYYIEDTEFDYYKVSLEDTIRIPKVDNGQIFHFNCYAVDFNGNMSAAKPITIEMPYTSPSTTNLALNKPIAIGAGSYATRANDGNTGTRMEGANSAYVNQWMYVDLQGYYTLDKIKIYFQAAYPTDFILQVAHTLPSPVDDDTKWRTIYAATGTPNYGDPGSVNTYDVSGSTARFVRFKSLENFLPGYGFSIWEFEVYGSAVTSKDVTAPAVSSAEATALVSDTQMQLALAASDGSKFFRIIDNQTEEKFLMEADASNHVVLTNKTYAYCEQYSFDIQAMDAAANLSAATTITPTIAPPALYNLATGASATAGHIEGGNTAAAAVDGNSGTRWGSNGGSDSEHWITVDMKKRYTVSSVKLSWETACPKKYYLKASIDGTHFYPVGYYTTIPSTSNNGSVYTTYTMEPGIEARYLQMYSIENNTIYGTSIFEFEAYGSCANNGTAPIMTYAEVIDLPISSSSASAEINVGAWDDATAFEDLNYRAVFTAGKSETIIGLTATDGILTLSGLTIGTTYTVRIYAVDGNSNVSADYKELTFTPKVKLYYLTGDDTGTTGSWQGALSTEESAAKRRFSATAHDGIYHFSISVLGDNQQYRPYYDVEGELTFVNDNNHWSIAGNQIISGHNGETIDVYAKDKDHFVSNFDEVYVYGAAIIDATTEGSAVRMSYADNKFAWEGFVASGTNAFRIIVKENGSSFTDHSRARIMPATDNFVNSSGWKYAKLTFDMETWEYEWSATDVSTYIYDDHSGDGKWSTTSNWLSGALPTIEKDVIITKPVTVDITTARANSVVIDKSDDNSGQLVLDAGKELVVATTVRKTTDGSSYTATGENDIVFNSTSGAGLGALVMGTHDGTNNATVNFATLSNGEEDKTASDAQYVGTPFGNHPKMVYQFYNSWMYKFINTGVPGWTRVDGEDGLDAFQGYCIFSADGTGHTYWMQGTLVASEDQTISLRYNGGDGSNANNENMLANSWMAPIQIAAFDASDFTNADATIYIYNTGSPDDYHDNNGATSTGTQAGQYSLYTVNTCPTTEIIPSMQAFSVYTHGSTPSISLDYSKIVYDPAVAGSVVPGRNRAPQRTETDEPEKMRLYIGAESGYGDMLYMLEREDFAEGFENGWDGRKMFGEDVAPQLYAFTPDGNMAINCIPTFEGQLLGFRKGAQDNTYTFTFEYDGDNMWYLNDLKEQTSTLISAFDSYTFTSEADDTEARFIISRSPIHSTPTAVESATGAQQPAIRKIVINDHVFIIRNGLMYDVTGIMVR